MKHFYLLPALCLTASIGFSSPALAQKQSRSSDAPAQPSAYPCPYINGTLSASTDNGPVGGTADANSWASAWVDIYTPVTIEVV